MSEFRATEEFDANEARINRVLAVAYQREAATQLHCGRPMTFGEILDQAPGDGESEILIKAETAIRLLMFMFQDGPHPGCVMRVVYLLAQRLKPELVLNMSGAELADMIGETRAAWSARNKRIFTRYLEERGVKASRGRLQKSSAACAKYAVAALGNTNRRGKTKPSATVRNIEPIDVTVSAAHPAGTIAQNASASFSETRCR